MIRNRDVVLTESGVRLDAALLRLFPSSTRAFVRDALSRGDVLVRRGASLDKVEKGRRLAPGTEVFIRELLEEKDNLVAPEEGDLAVVYEDASLVAFDKPAAMSVQPLSCRETGTLMNRVVARYPECRTICESVGGKRTNTLMAGALHRIDAGTSGLVLAARTQEAFDGVRAQFAAQTVVKTYLALVEGEVSASGVLEHDLAHDPTLPFCRMIDAHKNRLTARDRASLKTFHAVTAYAPLGMCRVESEVRTLLEVTIRTGVTHQIRAQLAFLGHPVVNDRLYGAFAVENEEGHCLHALALAFRHPATGGEIAIKTPNPTWAENFPLSGAPLF